MSVMTYKCPNCDGGLIFDPKTQKFRCEYCLAYFTEADLKGQTDKKTKEESHSASSNKNAAQSTSDTGAGVVYSCPSCGAEVVTDETTAATFCFYCHNPVVLSGRLDGSWKPEKLIPFTIQREEAVQQFLDWAKKKWFVPPAFFCKKQIEKVSGIYFPYWSADCKVKGSMQANAQNVRIWRAGDTEYTETKHYRIERAADIAFDDLVKSALKKANSKLAEGVQPFNDDGMIDFSMAYLSGFQAEKRDMETKDVMPDIQKDINTYTEQLLRNTINSYDSVNVVNDEANIIESKFHYVLLPVWALTYKSGDKIYYYAMNGQTGKTCGELPISYGRLAILFAGVAGALMAILSLIGGLLL